MVLSMVTNAYRVQTIRQVDSGKIDDPKRIMDVIIINLLKCLGNSSYRQDILFWE